MSEIKDTRGLALTILANYLQKQLGFPKGVFFEWFSMEEGSPSDKTLWRYSRGETPMARWSFEEFWEKAGQTIKLYIEEDITNGKTKESKEKAQRAAEKWERDKYKIEQYCRVFFIDNSAVERYADFPEHMGDQMIEDSKDVLTAFQEVFIQLPAEMVYSIQRNFLAYSRVTTDDISLLKRILVLSQEEKKKLKTEMSQEAAESIEIILERLTSEEAQCWVHIRDIDYTDTVRKGNTQEKSWERFCKQCASLEPMQIVTTILFLVVTVSTPGPDFDPKEQTIEALPVTPDDIDLIMLFKYCLTPEARKKIIATE